MRERLEPLKLVPFQWEVKGFRAGLETLMLGLQDSEVCGANTVGLMGSPLGQGPLHAASALIQGRTLMPPRSEQIREKIISIAQEQGKVDKNHFIFKTAFLERIELPAELRPEL